MKINVACGFDKMDGYINIDADPRVRPDIVRDIERGLPFGDNQVDEIFSKHTLEHISPDMIQFVMYEFWRVCRPEALIKIIVPINKGWMFNPEHKCPFSNESVIFFTDWNWREGYRFALKESKTLFVDENKPETEELHFTLEVIK